MYIYKTLVASLCTIITVFHADNITIRAVPSAVLAARLLNDKKN